VSYAADLWVAKHGVFDCNDGVNTGIVAAGGINLGMPELVAIDTGNIRTVGRRRVESTYNNRQASFTMHLQGYATSDLLQAAISNLIAACSQEHDFEFKPLGRTESVIFRCLPFLPNLPAFDWTHWRSDAVYEVQLDFELEPFGVGPISGLQAPYASQIGPAHACVTDIPGDIGALARVMIGPEPGGYGANRFCVGLLHSQGGSAGDLINDGAGGTEVADAYCHGGAYRHWSIGASWTTLFDTTLSLANYAGSYRAFARVRFTAGGNMRLSVQDSGAETARVYGAVASSRSGGAWGIYDLGLITLPALRVPDGMSSTTTISLQVNQPTGTYQLDCDFLVLVPTTSAFAYYADLVSYQRQRFMTDGISEVPGFYLVNDTLPNATPVIARGNIPCLGQAVNHIVEFAWTTEPANPASDDDPTYSRLLYYYQPRYLFIR
jgi:hypothetical protein